MNKRNSSYTVLNPFSGKLEREFEDLSVDDKYFVSKELDNFPRKIQEIVFKKYLSLPSGMQANSYLREISPQLEELLPSFLRDLFDANEAEISNAVQLIAQNCSQIATRHLQNISITSVNEKDETVNGLRRHDAQKYASMHEEIRVNEAKRQKAYKSAYRACSEYVEKRGVEPPQISKFVTHEGAIKRMKDHQWWRRRIKNILKKTREQAMIELEQVNSKRGKYCSDMALEFRVKEKLRQEKLLDEYVLVNEDNEEVSMRVVYQSNVSNPINRRNEFMTRMAGTEKLARALGHNALFITITCPSRFHNSYAKSGNRNPKWDGSTPNDANEYLNGVWQRLRAQLARSGIRQYGFRISEPQHDGTPHWHLLMFIEPSDCEELKQIYRHYALLEDGDEHGAKENRITFVEIDPTRGSATGYIAKYVSKNIDGGQLESDRDGGDAQEAAKRVEAWASTWGIRQFQQIGSVSVTVWRELRKANIEMEDPGKFELIYNAADESDWAEFVQLMGGVFCKRNEQSVRPFYSIEYDNNSGEVKQTYYDELPSKKLKGVSFEGKEIVTREHQWRIERRSEEEAA